MARSPAHTADGNTAQASSPTPQRQPGAAKWLAFQAAHLRYLFAIEHVGQVLQAQEVTKIPFTQPWFRGVINVRGVLHGVIDLAGFLSLGPGSDPATHTGAPDDTGADHLVTLGASLNWPCALLAGALRGLRGPQDFPEAPAGDVGAHPLVLGVRRDALNTPWMEISLPSLLASVRTRSIAIEQATP